MCKMTIHVTSLNVRREMFVMPNFYASPVSFQLVKAAEGYLGMLWELQKLVNHIHIDIPHETRE